MSGRTGRGKLTKCWRTKGRLKDTGKLAKKDLGENLMI